MSHSRQAGAVTAGIVLLLVVAGVGVAPSVVYAAVGDTPPLQQSAPTTNNSTVQHERPESVDESGDQEAVQSWLTDRMAKRLEASSIAISQQEYQQGNELVGEEFEDRLEQYVDVAGETDTNSDDERGERIQETAEAQRTYAETVEAYERTYERYQQAQANGNRSAARRYARQLANQSERIRATNRTLVENYEELERGGVGVGTAPATIANVTRRIEKRQARVQNQTFTATTLTVATDGETVSFTDPLQLTGEVTTANGTAVANQSVRIAVGNREYTSETNRTGAFTLQYRPISLPTTAQTADVRFRPRPTSPYLGTNTTIRVDVQQVTPTLTAEVLTPTAHYDEPATVRVTATVGGRPVPSLSVRATLAGSTVGRTNQDGHVRLTRRIPATLPDGSQQMSVARVREDAAVGPARTEATIQIGETETQLTTTTSVTQGRIVVRGYLRTASGAGVEEQPVVVGVEDARRTAITNQTGGYRLVLNTSAVERSDPNATVTVQFDGQGTSLVSAEAAERVTLPTESSASGDGGEGRSTALLVGGVLGVSALLASAAWLWHRRDTGATTDNTSGGTAVATEGSEATTEAPQQWLSYANEQLESTPKEAIVAAYAAIRTSVPSQRQDESLTHRELQTVLETHTENSETTAIKTVVDGYEQAMFAGTVDTKTASTVVEAAAEVIERT